MNNFKITIDKRVTEQRIVEQFLNDYFSGRDDMFVLSLYALANHWHIDKLEYYLNLRGNSK